MAIEIEKKYKLTTEQRAMALEKLKEQGATFSHEDFEVNELYGGGVLASDKAVLRVRKIGDRTILTYKKRIEDTASIKQQIEYETEVAGREAIENIIVSLGFKKKIVYEKRRQTWRLKDVEILVDELPFGFFMEIEGSVTEIVRAEAILGAESFTTEHKTYPNLTEDFGKSGSGIIEARFAKNS